MSAVAVGLFLLTTISLIFVKPFSPPPRPQVAEVGSDQKSPVTVVIGGEKNEDHAEKVLEAKV